ncbi:MAG: hypothetical protein A2857_01345 [Candidatus Levybacteria bacterium RIFCSPHIGHO2_01_FULL_36_15]|nr:MAG: hypothetical protein A2857_01345 [Candidatus Levybacteria bacterium RIFCSPHIGHO2_01_FULL_36_15]OGH38784.1 MAG: hypothetical protein A2905_02365 [Candidatus Levybacteria bacterium RIFCSPLOWO2_01_FULL_36_10]
MKEKILIIFIALALGLALATLGFYIFQSTKKGVLENSKKTDNINKTAENKDKTNGIILSIDSPTNESLVNERTIEVKGKTNPLNTIIVSSNLEDAMGSADSNGNFSINIGIDAGLNNIIVRSFSSTGDETKDERTVTFSQEDF